MFHIWAIFGAEIAAGVIGDEPQQVGRDVERGRKLPLVTHDSRPAGREEKRVAAGLLVVMGKPRPRLQGHRHYAADMKFHRHHVVGGSKSSISTNAIAKEGVDEDVVGRLVPDCRRAACKRILRSLYPAQRFIVHAYRVGCVFGLLAAFRDYHRDGLAEIAGLVGRQQHMAADEYCRARGTRQLHVVFG